MTVQSRRRMAHMIRTKIGSSSRTRCVPHEYDAMSGVAATTAAASSARPIADVARGRNTASVSSRTMNAINTVKTRAPAGLPRTVRNVSGSNSRASVPPGE